MTMIAQFDNDSVKIKIPLIALSSSKLFIVIYYAD